MQSLTTFIPLAIGVMWVLILIDWHKHAVNRRDFWLVVLVFTGLLGYAFFRNSSDRQQR